MAGEAVALLREARQMAHDFLLDKPVRNADEIFARIDAALAQHGDKTCTKP